MTAVRRVLPWLLLIGAIAGCNDVKPPPTLARFEQPNAVDFVCVVHDVVTRLDACAGDDSEDNGIALHALVTQHSRGEVAAIDMQAFAVLDSRRDIPGYTYVPVGQLPIAVVVPPNHPELTYVADFGSRDVRVLRTQALVAPLSSDADMQIVPLMAASGTGAGEVAAAPTHMELAPDEDALIVTAPDQGRVLWLPLVRCDDGSRTCENYGHVDAAHITSIDMAASVDRIADSSDEKPTGPYAKLCGYADADAATNAKVDVSDEQLARAARPNGLAIDAFCLAGRTCQRRILVSDESLPLIHALDIDALRAGTDPLLPPLVVGVAQKGVAVTPRVPVAIDSDQETQYVYAIDATDGSVLVTEHGRVLNINTAPNERPNRIEFHDLDGLGSPPAAAALTVMHPLFRVDEPAGQYVASGNYMPKDPDKANDRDAELFCTDDQIPGHTMEDPARLRGVFLAVATTDGNVRIVDVHDMELLDVETKNDAGDTVVSSCRACPTDRPVPIAVRNRERIELNFVTEEGADPIPLTLHPDLFAYYVDGVGFTLRADGTSGSPEAPALECIACDPGQKVVYPDPAEAEVDSDIEEDADGGVIVGRDSCAGKTPALLCANDDPWSASEERWFASYETTIPGSTGADARFIAPSAADNRTGSPEVSSGVDFCTAGVLGGDVIAAAFTGDDCADAADAPAGDQLVISAGFLGEARLRDVLKTSGMSGGELDEHLKDCAEATKALDEDPDLVMAFAIRRAYRDRLVIDAQLLNRIPGLSTYEDVQRCIGGTPMTFQVRTRDAFTVVGDLSGFLHGVKADSAGRCVVDPAADPLLRGRARLGCTFRNHAFTIRMRKPGKDDPVQEPPPGLALGIKMQTPAGKLIADLASQGLGFAAASVVPVQLKYNDADRQLYLVDIQDRGLVPMPLDPFPRTVDANHTFN